MKRLFTLISIFLCAASMLFTASCNKKDGGTSVKYVKGTYTYDGTTYNTNFCYYATNPRDGYADHLLLLTPTKVADNNISEFFLYDTYIFVAFPEDRFGETVVFDGNDNGHNVTFYLKIKDTAQYFGNSHHLDNISSGTVKVSKSGEGRYRLEADIVMNDGKEVRCTLDGLFRQKSYGSL